MPPNSGTTFKHLRVVNWRQFVNVDIELHNRLTVLTGANGAGKSTLIRIFSRHSGFDRPILATPVRTATGGYSYITGLFTPTGFFSQLFDRLVPKVQQNQIGVIRYANNAEAILQVPPNSGATYSLNISNQQTMYGMHIDSHQPISVYQAVGNIPTHIVNSEQAYQNYHGEVYQRYSGNHGGHSPIYRMKEAIISMAMFGEGNKYAPGNKTVLEAYLGFVETLRKMLPSSLGFQDLEIRSPEVVVKTATGEFMLDAASGGLMTLIDLAWRLYMFSLNHDSFVVTIDEPENHLHPSMQRSLMGALIRTFPKAQFIIATHSPFMVSSVKDAHVYVLRYVTPDNEGLAARDSTMGSRVVSEKLDTINKAGNASEILREVLGVSTTLPEWVEEDLGQIVARYRNREITTETLRELRAELASRGLGEMYPDALATVTEGQ